MCWLFCLFSWSQKTSENHCTAASFENRFPQILGYISVYVYVYIYIYMYLKIYVYIYIEREREREWDATRSPKIRGFKRFF